MSRSAACSACVSLQRIVAQLERELEARRAEIELVVAQRDAAREQLADRKVIERAKGVLMAQASLTESQAYTQMRRTAMREARKLVDVARDLLVASA